MILLLYCLGTCTLKEYQSLRFLNTSIDTTWILYYWILICVQSIHPPGIPAIPKNCCLITFHLASVWETLHDP
jgi:hypothetical protein